MGYNVHEASSWWEIRNGSASETEARGALRLKIRCVHIFGWTDEFCDKVLSGYRDFLLCKRISPETKIIPSFSINQMWQQHILDTQNYARDCQLLVGKLLHYPADQDDNEEEEVYKSTKSKRIADTKALLCQVKNCSPNDLDGQVWSFPSSTESISDSKSLNKQKASLSVDELDTRPTTRTKHCHDTDDEVDIEIIWTCGDTQKQEVTNFKISKTLKFDRIFHAYSKQKKIEREFLTFLLKDFALEGTETADQFQDHKLCIVCEPIRWEC